MPPTGQRATTNTVGLEADALSFMPVNRRRALLALLELFRGQLVAGQQFVEVGTVAPRQACRLADVAAGDLQDLRQVAAREFIARLVEGGQAARSAAERLLHQLHRDDG